MSSLLCKLLKHHRSSSSSSSSHHLRLLISSFHSLHCSPSPFLPITQTILSSQIPIATLTPMQPPSINHNERDKLQFYPSFPHCLFGSNPISAVGIDDLVEEENSGGSSGSEEAVVVEVWADSVKKKRKRKMNKHKYRKLRKRLRRQT